MFILRLVILFQALMSVLLNGISWLLFHTHTGYLLI